MSKIEGTSEPSQARLSSEREKLRRVMLCIEELATDQNGRIFTVIVPRWSDTQTVSLSESAIPESMRSGLKPGSFLIASGNVDHAPTASDLVLQDFQRLHPDDEGDDEGL